MNHDEKVSRELCRLQQEVADLAMLVGRLSRFAPPGPAGVALDYLKRHGLMGSVLRTGPRQEVGR